MIKTLKNLVTKPPSVISILLSAALSISCAENAFAAGKRCEVAGDGRLNIYNYRLDETLETTFKTRGSYDQRALEAIYKVLRSPDGKEHAINSKLLDIIDYIQDHFGARTVEVISGYRSPAYNRRLRLKGRDVAKESLHMEGRAIDIHIDEITEEELARFASGLKCGGVGIYPSLDFVHIDVGPVRRWGEPRRKRKLVGIENNRSPYIFTTDKNDYFTGDVILLTTSGPPGRIQAERYITVERFDRGRWKEAGKIDIRKPIDLPFGRYRLKFKALGALSNEFYVKKI